MGEVVDVGEERRWESVGSGVVGVAEEVRREEVRREVRIVWIACRWCGERE